MRYIDYMEVKIMKKREVNKLVSVMLSGMLAAAMLAGCGSTVSSEGSQAATTEATKEASTESTEAATEKASESSGQSEEATSEAASEGKVDEEENYETGDASLDDPLNADDIGEKEILVVSFGTSYNDSRRETIGAVEKAVADANPEWSVRRAFTSNIIIDHVRERDGEEIDDLEAALDRAVKNGVKELVVQPTHLMNGHEYTDIETTLAKYADSFEKIELAKQLLDTDEDFEAVISAITDATTDYDDGETAIVYMGHGTTADSNSSYAKIQEMLTADGYENYFITTVEASPTPEETLEMVKKGDYKKVVLLPLMVVAGDHANNDMAGDDDDSIKSLFEKAGYEVETVIQGLGANEDIQEIYLEHVSDAVEKIEE